MSLSEVSAKESLPLTGLGWLTSPLLSHQSLWARESGDQTTRPTPEPPPEFLGGECEDVVPWSASGYDDQKDNSVGGGVGGGQYTPTTL